MVYNIYEVFLYIHLYAIDKHGFQNHTSITRVGMVCHHVFVVDLKK